MNCPFNHQPCLQAGCPLWNKAVGYCVFCLAMLKLSGLPPVRWEKNPDLSATHLDILVLLSKGRRNSEIAETLHISRRTVTKRVAELVQRLDAKSRAHAVTIAVQKGII